MNNETIIKSLLYLPQKYCNHRDFEWGSLFFNCENKMSYDSNQGIITCKSIEKEQLDFIKKFYSDKKIIPRAISFEKPENLRYTHIQNRSFMVYDTSPSPLLLSRKKAQISEEFSLDDEIFKNIFSEPQNIFIRYIFEKNLNQKRFHLLAARLFDKPVCVSTVEETPFGITYISNLVTSPGFRGCGLASEMIRFATQFSLQSSSNRICLLTDNPTAEKIYEKAGFEKIKTGVDTVYTLI